MYGWHDMNGWSWFFGSLLMVFWLVVIGAVVYVAVKLAQGNRPEHGS